MVAATKKGAVKKGAVKKGAAPAKSKPAAASARARGAAPAVKKGGAAKKGAAPAATKKASGADSSARAATKPAAKKPVTAAKKPAAAAKAQPARPAKPAVTKPAATKPAATKPASAAKPAATPRRTSAPPSSAATAASPPATSAAPADGGAASPSTASRGAAAPRRAWRFERARAASERDALTDLERAQLAVACTFYDGLQTRADALPASAYSEDIVRWRVLDGAEHVFDFWEFAPDSGTLFFARDTEPVGIEVCQGGWDVVAKQGWTKRGLSMDLYRLAWELGEAFRAARGGRGASSEPGPEPGRPVKLLAWKPRAARGHQELEGYGD